MTEQETQQETVPESEAVVQQAPVEEPKVEAGQVQEDAVPVVKEENASSKPVEEAEESKEETKEPETTSDASTTSQAADQDHPMRKMRVAKVTLNIGAGKSEDVMKRGIKLLQKLSPLAPVKTTTSKRIPGWGLRPGLAIGCKVTVRKDTEALLKRLLVAKENVLLEKNFDDNGNFSFGIPEYIDIEGLEYDPDLKIMGLEVAVTLERPGYRIKRRKIRSTSVGGNHGVTKQDAIGFAKKVLGVEVQ